ncbi:TRAP transporter small permease [Zobellella endophytica]|nr:TRAP transporter small permease subunit [Zobellella endophytica]
MNVQGKLVYQPSCSSTGIRLLCGLDKATEYTAIGIFMAAIISLFLFLGADVVVRYLTTQSLGWPAEMPNLLFPWLVMGAIVAAAQRGQHVAVNAVLGLLNIPVTRVLMLVMQLVVVVTFSYLSYIGVEVVRIAGKQLFPISGISSSYAYMALVYGFGAIALTALTNILWWLADPSAFDNRMTKSEVAE